MKTLTFDAGLERWEYRREEPLQTPCMAAAAPEPRKPKNWLERWQNSCVSTVDALLYSL